MARRAGRSRSTPTISKTRNSARPSPTGSSTSAPTTAMSALESTTTRYHAMKRLMITADGGGSRHFQMEQDRTSHVLPHHTELARHASRQPICRDRPDRQHHDEKRSFDHFRSAATLIPIFIPRV